MNRDHKHTTTPSTRSLILVTALLALVALTSLAALAGAAQKNDGAAKATISKVTVNGKKVTVTGKVKLPAGATPSRTKVLLSLLDSSGKVEKASAKVDTKDRFKLTKTTALTGDLTVVAAVKIAGKASGRQVSKRFPGPPASSNAAGPGSKKVGGGGAPTGTPLVGLFKLDPGKQALSGQISGTYFRMLSPGGTGIMLINGDSPLPDLTYTPLSPGSDGGLSTVEYQPAPSPAFEKVLDGLPNGNALASRVVQPQKFFGVNFSIVTDSIGRGTSATGDVTSEPTPLPVILNDNGKLSGQVTAWTAAWNGLWFTQGSPKPDGTLGGTWNVGGTTALTGTYDAATRHYQLTWQSAIQGGPFGGYSGQWFLEGTFVPAA